jgi:hypothetical protein
MMRLPVEFSAGACVCALACTRTHKSILYPVSLVQQLVSSMEHQPFWQVCSHRTAQEISSAFYGIWRFITIFTSGLHWLLPWRLIQSRPYFSNMPSNIVLPFRPKPSKWSLYFRFSDLNFIWMSSLPCCLCAQLCLSIMFEGVLLVNLQAQTHNICTRLVESPVMI